ncbi:MAG TPA: RagB/SusD family nutrient uptake outer membrane protein, partial [Niastella sp.]
MKSINIYFRLTGIAFCLVAFCSCKKYLDISLPKDKITDATVFSNATNTLAAVNGLYTFAFKSSNFLNYQGDLLLGIAADEFIFGGTQYDEFMNNALPPDNQYVLATWQTFYSIIYQANAIIENVPGSPVPDSLRSTYIAEAKVLRAY